MNLTIDRQDRIPPPHAPEGDTTDFPSQYIIGPAAIAPGNGSIIDARVAIAQGRIVQILAPAGPADISLPDGTIIAPGLIDLHTNGDDNRIFNRDHAVAIETVSKAYAGYGATGFLATVMTAPWESMLYAAGELAEAANALEEAGNLRGARCLGLHFEGPFLNPRGRGIHRPEWLMPASQEAVHAILEACAGALMMVTMAPEVHGAYDAARIFSGQGVICSAGHTAARYGDGEMAITCGFRTVTHAFNAMPPLDHRDPSLLLAFLHHDITMPQVICDGYHVAPPMIELLYRLLGSRLILSTDKMPPAGSGYHVRDGLVRSEDGTIAGSMLNPAQAIRNLMVFAKIPFESAILNGTLAPARLLGIDSEMGKIAVGYRADFSIWNNEHEVIATIVGGHPVFGLETLRLRSSATI